MAGVAVLMAKLQKHTKLDVPCMSTYVMQQVTVCSSCVRGMNPAMIDGSWFGRWDLLDLCMWWTSVSVAVGVVPAEQHCF